MSHIPTPLDTEIERVATAAAGIIDDPAMIDQAAAEFRAGTLRSNGGEPVTDEFLRGSMFGAWKVYSSMHTNASAPDADRYICADSLDFVQRVAASMALYVREMRRSIEVGEAFNAVVAGGAE